jgi:hypothetical protein
VVRHILSLFSRHAEKKDLFNTTIAQSCLNDEFEETLNTSNELCDHVEEQCIDTECTTTVHVHVDPFTQLKKKVLEFVDMPFVCKVRHILSLFSRHAEKKDLFINKLIF